jgi:hypothetical protein
MRGHVTDSMKITGANISGKPVPPCWGWNSEPVDGGSAFCGNVDIKLNCVNPLEPFA